LFNKKCCASKSQASKIVDQFHTANGIISNFLTFNIADFSEDIVLKSDLFNLNLELYNIQSVSYQTGIPFKYSFFSSHSHSDNIKSSIKIHL
jgi:hypothetical protein